MHSVVRETEELEKRREVLEKELSKVQQKELEWENKVKSVNEMKKHILNDQSEKGDIGSMKNEIHRMEVGDTESYTSSSLSK